MKSDNSISWLHLSDLHIAESVEWNIMKLCYEKLAEQLQPKFIIITGDCRRNEASDYTKTLDFLNKLVKLFKIDKKNVFLVPGNHDTDNSSARKAIIKGLVSEMTKNPKEGEKYLDSTKDLKKFFSNYSEFIKKFYEEELTNNDERKNNSAGVVHLTWKNQINIILLNTSLISDGDRSHKEILDVDALTRISNTIDNTIPTLLLAHHSFYSIYESQRKQITALFDNLNVKAYLCGDKHKYEIKTIKKYNDLNNTIPCIICGKSVTEPTDTYSDAGIMSYSWNKTDGYVYITHYKWKKDEYHFIESNNNDLKFFMSEKLYKDPKIYSSLRYAHDDIAKDIRQSTFIEFYGLRGKTFLDSEDSIITPEIKNKVLD